VTIAKLIASTFTSTQLSDYGNVILNGYATVVANTTSKKAWQYAQTTTAPVNLPSLTLYTPIMKGWSTNYAEYYTQLPVNAYGTNPGDPTMFEYSVHSFSSTNAPKWAQPPHRAYQNTVAAFVAPNNNSQAIQYSFIYPKADSLVAPPVGSL
jgi:hypothetical protein